MSIINHLCMQVYIDLQRQTHSAQMTPRIQASVSAGVRCADEDVLAVPRPQAPGGGGGGGGAALTCPVLSSNDLGLRPPRGGHQGFPRHRRRLVVQCGDTLICTPPTPTLPQQQHIITHQAWPHIYQLMMMTSFGGHVDS